MKILILGILCTMHIITQYCSGIKFLDIPERDDIPLENLPKEARRFWLRNFGEFNNERKLRQTGYEDEKDDNLKSKIATLVDQTLYDTDRKVKSAQQVKDKHRDQLPYKIGFILSMIKKTRDVLNELFNVAVKHRDEWKALEQLKVFELIVHTNVDTTNLVRQLVELHIQNLNLTTFDSRRVVLIK